MNICKIVYDIGANGKIYGNEPGVCIITGDQSIGMPVKIWMKDTFNDHDKLHNGTIVSNEACFCFDESSEIVQQKTGKEKPQRFRTYSHIIKDCIWYCVTKADKKLIFELISGGAEIVSLTETGQKHVFFKHKQGFWQLDELYIVPDIDTFKLLHYNMCELMAYEISQGEIISGNYLSGRILKAGFKNWSRHEKIIKQYRGSAIFDFVSFMLFTEKKNDTEEKPKKLEVKPNSDIAVQLSLF